MRRSFTVALIAAAITLLGLMLALAGCGSKSNRLLTPAPGGPVAYQGTASVGDFITIVVDYEARTITYENRSNGLSGVASFTVGSDGSYTVSDPNGNFVSGYEIPGYALVLESHKSGPGQDAKSLVFAILRESFRKSDISSSSYNYMQFRTSSGGMELGSTVIDGAGNVHHEGYWPYGGATGSSSFLSGSFSTDLFLEHPAGHYLYGAEPGSSDTTYVFRTRGGFVAVDTPNGSHILFRQQPGKNFLPAWAGSYGAIVYRKEQAHMDGGMVETGIPAIHRGTIDITGAGHITLRDAAGDTVVTTTLVPVADVPELVGPDQLTNPCHGLFTFSIVEGDSREDVFVAFLNDALVLASFRYEPASINTGGQYSYLYGAALRR